MDFTIKLRECGKIKIGGKDYDKPKTTGKGKVWYAPKKYDHFRIIKNEKDSNGRYIEDTETMKILGDNPKSLNIALVFDDILKNVICYKGMYSGHKRVCWKPVFMENANHGTKRRKYTEEGGKIIWLNEYEDVEKDKCDKCKNKDCKLHTVFNCMLLDAPGVGGIYVLRTTSGNTNNYIYSSLLTISRFTNGILAGIPLKLLVHPEWKTTEAGEKLIYTISCRYERTIPELKDLASREIDYRQKIGYTTPTSLPAIELKETPEEESDIQEEFHPESPEEAEKKEKELTGQQEITEPTPSTPTEPEIVEPVVTPQSSAKEVEQSTGNPVMDTLFNKERGDLGQMPEQTGQAKEALTPLKIEIVEEF